jgi:hypothetical protein
MVPLIQQRRLPIIIRLSELFLGGCDHSRIPDEAPFEPGHAGVGKDVNAYEAKVMCG